ILRAHRIDVVHAHKGKGRTLALMAGLFVRIPVLILNRGVSFPLDRFQRLGYTTRRVTAIIAVCESIKRALVRSGVDGKKVEVIYSGTDTARFHPGIDGGPVRRELGFTPDDFVITQIGVRSWKGNDDVIDAMVWLAAAAPQARLLIVGARNPGPTPWRARCWRTSWIAPRPARGRWKAGAAWRRSSRRRSRSSGRRRSTGGCWRKRSAGATESAQQPVGHEARGHDAGEPLEQR